MKKNLEVTNPYILKRMVDTVTIVVIVSLIILGLLIGFLFWRRIRNNKKVDPEKEKENQRNQFLKLASLREIAIIQTDDIEFKLRLKIYLKEAEKMLKNKPIIPQLSDFTIRDTDEKEFKRRVKAYLKEAEDFVREERIMLKKDPTHKRTRHQKHGQF